MAFHFGNRFGQGIAHEDQASLGPARLLCDVDPAERPIMVGADDELAAGRHIGAAARAGTGFFDPHFPLSQRDDHVRSEEPTSELPSLMRISYAVFCLKKNIRY